VSLITLLLHITGNPPDIPQQKSHQVRELHPHYDLLLFGETQSQKTGDPPIGDNHLRLVEDPFPGQFCTQFIPQKFCKFFHSVVCKNGNGHTLSGFGLSCR
jgi:hypothetical protein